MEPFWKLTRLALYAGAVAATTKIAQASSSRENMPDEVPCSVGYSLVEERLFQPPVNLSFGNGQPFSLSVISTANLRRYTAELGILSRDEARLAQNVRDLPITVSTRTSPGAFEKMVSSHGIIPRRTLVSRGLNPSPGFVSATEEDLFGAHDWVFTTISSTGWKGSSAHGGLVLGVKEAYWRSHSWATPTSGLRFYENFLRLPKGAASRDGIPTEYLAQARAAFQATVVQPSDYSRWIALDVIRFLRSQPESVRAEFFKADPKTLVELMNKYHLGFLEAKFPGIPLDSLEILEHPGKP